MFQSISLQNVSIVISFGYSRGWEISHGSMVGVPATILAIAGVWLKCFFYIFWNKCVKSHQTRVKRPASNQAYVQRVFRKTNERLWQI